MALCHGLATAVTLKVILILEFCPWVMGLQVLVSDFCVFLVTKVWKYFITVQTEQRF